MPVNILDKVETKKLKASKEDSQLVLDVMARIKDLQDHRSRLKANPYDDSGKSRTIEETWDFDDYVTLPHKYSHPEMQPWMSDNSQPIVWAKIESAVALLVAKNPAVDVIEQDSQFEQKAKVIEALYNVSWEKGNGRQQLVKFVRSLAKYGFVVGREYHRYKKQKINVMVDYDPDENRHMIEERDKVIFDEPYFEVLPIRDCWFDYKARPYDEDSMRDWCWTVLYDYSTFEKEFPKSKYPNAEGISGHSESNSSVKSKSDIDDSVNGFKVRLWFYEDKENDQFIITDGMVLLYEGPLINHELSCVTAMWNMRHEHTIYGVGLPEILENNQEMLDKIMNMSLNQIILSISATGFYGGLGDVKATDMILEPKLKKLRDSDKINFVKIPSIDSTVFNMLEVIKNDADEFSGITKSLSGEQVGKTLGEAVLNREAGLRRLSLPLGNIEFALERHAKLRINNIQLIYSRPQASQEIVNDMGLVLSEKLWQEYKEERVRLGQGHPSFVQKFPDNPQTGQLFKNSFRKERLPLEKTEDGKLETTEQDKWLEITPDEIEGEFDVKIRAFSTLPMSQTLEESKALETFNLIAKLPYTDIYKAQRRLLKKRKEDPDDWMITEDQILQNQQAAEQAGAQGMMMEEGASQGALVPPGELEQPASSQGLSAQVAGAFK